jgi:selenocysteine-specific elongation factor
MMRVIGTAGHVDHGKSTLVEALTGVHPDRLKEEREREMTIDLGFGWLALPGGESIGIVDVPGHIDFIENMLAGVGSLDAALLVIAADEGVMPQTREHLAILDLLKVAAGVVALTKIDLVEADWLALVMAEVGEALRGSVLSGAPLVPVSARSGAGIPSLLQALETTLTACPIRPDRGRPRLAVDRVFSVAGFGTVVTGTLIDGSMQVGDEVEILPRAQRARVRGLQTHKTKIERAVPGSRVAINLSGVEAGDVKRGDVVASPGWLRPTLLFDARFEHLQNPGFSQKPGFSSDLHPLKHNAEVKVFHGAAEVTARVRLIGDEVLRPGREGWAQFALAEPLALVKGDRFIARLPSPSLTLGGGVVVDAQPGRRHKRFKPEVMARLETLAQGSPAELLLQALDAGGPMAKADLLKRANLPYNTAAGALAELEASGEVLHIGGDAPGIVASRAGWANQRTKLAAELAAYHAALPLRSGMPREELKSRLKLDAKIFNAVVAQSASEGVLAENVASLRAPDFKVTFSPAQQKSVDALIARFDAQPWAAPSLKESESRVGADVLAALIELGRIVKLSEDVLLLQETYQAAIERLIVHLKAGQTLTVAQARDLFDTSRKYALALLEYLDAQGITRRVGDARVLKREGAAQHSLAR